MPRGEQEMGDNVCMPHNKSNTYRGMTSSSFINAVRRLIALRGILENLDPTWELILVVQRKQ